MRRAAHGRLPNRTIPGKRLAVRDLFVRSELNDQGMMWHASGAGHASEETFFALTVKALFALEEVVPVGERVSSR